MWLIRLLFFLWLNCLLFVQAAAQEIETNSLRERNFAFEIKQIDEFFERFNNEKDAFFTKYIKSNYPGVPVDRKSLMANLLDRYKTWKKKDTNDFFRQVTDRANPVYLGFCSEWYAEASCKFAYNGRSIDVNIVLKIEQDANGGLKWMIKSAGSANIATIKNVLNISERTRHLKYLNSMSHATNFISLSVALNDKPNIGDYLDDSFFHSPAAVFFLNAVLKNQLHFLYVKNIRYHFLQVDGWIFTVDRISRQSVNAGWLISGLSRAKSGEKEAYLGSLLRINEQAK